jgi:hypothetical protein
MLPATSVVSRAKTFERPEPFHTFILLLLPLLVINQQAMAVNYKQQ